MSNEERKKQEIEIYLLNHLLQAEYTYTFLST